MAKIYVTDVTLHVDEALDKRTRAKLEKDLRSLDGVTSVRSSKKMPHMIFVKYETGHLRNQDILKVILGDHLHAEIVS
jgi:hypothetical protein